MCILATSQAVTSAKQPLSRPRAPLTHASRRRVSLTRAYGPSNIFRAFVSRNEKENGTSQNAREETPTSSTLESVLAEDGYSTFSSANHQELAEVPRRSAVRRSRMAPGRAVRSAHVLQDLYVPLDAVVE